jgi:hypothetical protein
MRVGDDLFVGEAAELVADHLELVVEAGGAEAGAAGILAHERDERGAGLGRVAGHEGGDGGRCGRRRGRRGSGPCRRGAGSRTGSSAGRRRSGRGIRQAICRISASISPNCPASEPRGPGLHLAQALDIGGEPGEAVGGALVGLERGAADPAAGGDAVMDGGARALEQRVERRRGRGDEPGQIVEDGRAGGDVLAVWGIALSLHCWPGR